MGEPTRLYRQAPDRRTVLAMSKGLGIVLAGILTATATVAASVAAPPADAGDTRKCVTKREFERVAGTHYTMRRVHRIYDSAGVPVVVSGDGDQIRRYRRCDDGSKTGAFYEWSNGEFRLRGTW